ncbi:MAG: hydrogenase maturation protease [Acidobacteria bacterium]|nr:hydrogenase maturation protease [Acidobacteriota bacterium]MBI3427195.1 hydrogenase maturation protease [Acidobacteriota bacterium]
MEKRLNAIVLGIGNPLLGDDGFGVEVARQLKDTLDDIEIVDGGSQGLYLLPYLQGRTHIIVADAIAFGGQPGEIVKLDAAQVPAKLRHKISEHQIGFNEVLALLQLLGETPREFLFFGVQPKHHEWAAPLSDEVAAAIPQVVEQIKTHVQSWGMGQAKERKGDYGTNGNNGTDGTDCLRTLPFVPFIPSVP